MNGLNPPDKAVFQADLYSVGMHGGFCQDILHDAFGTLPGSLVLLQHNRNLQAGHNIGSFYSVSQLKSFVFNVKRGRSFL
jgi:hypothetical protein